MFNLLLQANADPTGGFPILLDSIYKFGVLPILLIIIWALWKEVKELKQIVSKLNDEHKTDIRSGSDEIKGLHQSTIEEVSRLNSTLTIFTEKMSEVATKMTEVASKIQ